MANYEHLIQFWKSADHNKSILDVEYEKLVKNEMETAKEIWGHCMLEGNYNPEKRKSHFAYTASMQQVTKDIYSSSLQKKDFSRFKDSFMEDLETQREYWKKKIGHL